MDVYRDAVPVPAPADLYKINRVTIPSSFCDPEAAYELYEKCFDIYKAADDLGLDIMVNEHHATATCLNSALPLSLAILARETSQARLLCLGNPMANRPDPVRVAEEMAIVDVISRGRLELGVVRGVPQEQFPTNSNPVDMKVRMWEAIDLLIKALSTHDGPFSWDGQYFHFREVNVWPRPYQQPHPPMWMSTLTPSSAAELAERDLTVATLGNGIAGCGPIFEAYRSRAKELGLPTPPPEKFAYSPFLFIGDTDEEAHVEVRKLMVWATEQLRSPGQFVDIPGYMPPEQRAMMARIRRQGRLGHAA